MAQGNTKSNDEKSCNSNIQYSKSMMLKLELIPFQVYAANNLVILKYGLLYQKAEYTVY